MIKLSRTFKASPIRLRFTLTCALSVLAACGQGTSSSNTTALGTDNSLADAPPPATALPLATGPASAYRPAPVASALPPAPRARLGRVPSADQYAYLNQAQAFSQSLADAPPDYTYDYAGERPWVWQSPDGYYRVAERLPMGVRYFYYAPGASTPYLVQDPQYSYGYSGDQLTVVYGPGGEVLPDDVEARQARAAGVYLAWAASLYAAARHEQHIAVAQERWDAERQAVYADQARWTAARQRNSDWTAYSQAHQNDEAHWADQRYVRAAEAARFAQAVHDQTAFAHAQQAATDARVIAQSRGERPPGPPPADRFERNRPSSPNGRPPGLAVGDPAGVQHQQVVQQHQQTAAPARAPFQARDQAGAPPRAGVDSNHPLEPHDAAQGVAGVRAQQATQVDASRQAAQARPAQTREALIQQAQVHNQQASARQAQAAEARRQTGEQAAAQAHQAQAAETAQRAAAERAQVDAHRQAAEEAAAHVQAQRNTQAAQAAEGRKAEEAQAHAPGPRPSPISDKRHAESKSEPPHP
jgi:hypothetical protein